MLFCAHCTSKNCCKLIGQEGLFPPNCPSLREDIPAFLAAYQEPNIHHLACVSAVSSIDHSESRAQQTVNFARGCGFRKLGIAFCEALADSARTLADYLRHEGFQVESVICKVGHHDRVACLGVNDFRGKPMCNPIAQAEYLNLSGTELNIAVGLCVGHDAIFFHYSKAPVTVLITKDHRYNNCPEKFLKDLRP